MKYLIVSMLISFSTHFACAQIRDASSILKDSLDKANNNAIKLSGPYITKLHIVKSDSSMWLSSDRARDHRIVGYQKPNVKSKRELLISIFTSDVLGNPFQCSLGSYYDTENMTELSLKFIKTNGRFIKAKVIKADSSESIVYFLNKWVVFDK